MSAGGFRSEHFGPYKIQEVVRKNGKPFLEFLYFLSGQGLHFVTRFKLPFPEIT